VNVPGPLDRSLVPASRGVVSTAAITSARRAAPVQAAAAAESPAEPAFQDLLTPEEREFFALESARGPLTYGPRRVAAAGAAIATGIRLDVRG